MNLILFSKHFPTEGLSQLIKRAHQLGVGGYDFCIRPNYPIDPHNALTELKKWKADFAREGITIPMITGPGDLVEPDHPVVEPLLKALDQNDIRLLKIGYFYFDPNGTTTYWKRVEELKLKLKTWEQKAKTHQIKILLHTHSRNSASKICMGNNAGTLMHLLKDFDPRYLGAYLDTGHLELEGESFDLAEGICHEYFSALSLKDVLKLSPQPERKRATFVYAGEGDVDWPLVAHTLKKISFAGPISIHAEYPPVSSEIFEASLPKEVSFFKKLLD
jgi:sugar phosphate isomerase/epimerase